MTRKINWNNIALIIGVSLFDIAAGAYDRIVNNSGMLKSVSDWYVSISSQTPVVPAVSSAWNSTTITLQSSVGGYSLLIMGIIVVFTIGLMGVLFSTMGFRAA